jgi:hypothetical protein
MRVLIDYDKDISFENYKTFSFVKPKHKPQGRKGIWKNPLFGKEVLREIQHILESKGFEKAESKETADLLIHFYTMVQHRRDYVPPSYRVSRWGRVWRARPGHVVHYKEGTLVIDIVDREKKDLVWQGIGKGILDRHNPAANLVEATEEVLKEFPPVSD